MRVWPVKDTNPWACDPDALKGSNFASLAPREPSGGVAV